MDTRLIEYLYASPYKVMSGSTRALIRNYREYIKTCRIETHNEELNILDEEVIINKRVLANKIYKLKKCIPVKKSREIFRKSVEYFDLKKSRFLHKVKKF